MNHDLEKNKIFAAVLVAGIVAMFCGFVAGLLVHPHTPHETAIEIDTSALETASAGGAATGPEPILALLATADVKKGEALSKACIACHSFDQNGANKVGPNLWGIVNAKKAHKSDFAYSDALKAMADKGETWTYQNLSHFLWKPASYAKGTKMSFPGLKKPQDRADVIAYLRTLSAAPASLPSDADIAAEAPPPSSSEAVGQTNEKTEPATGDAKANDQSKGEESTPGKANPALTGTQPQSSDK
jgi:cytochrome c